MSVLATVTHILRFWEFVDGYYLLQGVDLIKMFNKIPADRMMNVLESLAVEEAIRDGKAEGAIEKARTQIVKINGNQPTLPDDDEVVESDPIAGWVVSDREKVTGQFDEGMKVHNSATFRLEAPADGSSDSPFA